MGSRTRSSNETARFHHAPRRRGGLAARGARAAGGARAAQLMADDENDPVAKTWASAFIQALAGLGWRDGPRVQMDLRWGRDDINRIGVLAQELVGLQLLL